MEACRLCGHPAPEQLIDFGPQPICSRFLQAPRQEEALYPLRLGQCGQCGLVQLTAAPPADQLPPVYGWISYREPEEHLDDLADRLAALPGLGPDAVFLGVSPKDDTLIERMKQRGFTASWRLDLLEDLEASQPGANVETVQDKLTPERAEGIAKRRGQADVVLARHIWEHAYGPDRFLAGMAGLLKPGGYLLLEVPDSQRGLETNHLAMIWEEHTLYLTEATLLDSVARLGYGVRRFWRFPLPNEDSLVVALQPGQAGQGERPLDLAKELELGRKFAAGFAKTGELLRRDFTARRDRGEKLAFFGAGHMTACFLNFLGLKDLVEFVADDHPAKQRLFMPGSGLAIRSSSSLAADDVAFCVFGVNPDSEDKIIAANGAFGQKGGSFASLVPYSPRALPAFGGK